MAKQSKTIAEKFALLVLQNFCYKLLIIVISSDNANEAIEKVMEKITYYIAK